MSLTSRSNPILANLREDVGYGSHTPAQLADYYLVTLSNFPHNVPDPFWAPNLPAQVVHARTVIKRWLRFREHAQG